jgi:hypothetical protein
LKKSHLFKNLLFFPGMLAWPWSPWEGLWFAIHALIASKNAVVAQRYFL